MDVISCCKSSLVYVCLVFSHLWLLPSSPLKATRPHVFVSSRIYWPPLPLTSQRHHQNEITNSSSSQRSQAKKKIRRREKRQTQQNDKTKREDSSKHTNQNLGHTTNSTREQVLAQTPSLRCFLDRGCVCHAFAVFLLPYLSRISCLLSNFQRTIETDESIGGDGNVIGMVD